LQPIEPRGKADTLICRVKKPLTPIQLPCLLHDPSVVDQLLQNASKTLLGDLQDVEQVRDFKPGMAIDEMEHPMVGPSQTVFGECGIRFASEVSISEEQQLNDGEEPRVRSGGRCPARLPIRWRLASAQQTRDYVSHVDLFGPDC
jgi:hypothetical protein